MTDTTHLLSRIDATMKTTAAKRNNWPGMPIGHVDLHFQAELDAAVRNGEVEVVERPSKINPERIAKFVRRTGA